VEQNGGPARYGTRRLQAVQDMGSSPSSILRTRTVIDGFILAERELLRDKEEQQSVRQCRVKSAPE